MHPGRRRSRSLVVIYCLPVTARIAPDEVKKMQEAAPEHVHLTITKVDKKAVEKNGKHTFHLTVHAKVIKLLQTKSGLEAGMEIVVKYGIPNQEKTPQEGDWPSQVREGQAYQALAGHLFD